MTRKIRIIVKEDPSCEMAMVEVDRRHNLNLPGMTGNYWDFHPGCHGITEYGDFRGFFNLLHRIEFTIRELGYEPVVDYKRCTYPSDF